MLYIFLYGCVHQFYEAAWGASRAREGRQAKYFALRHLETDSLDRMASYLKSSGPPGHKQALLSFRLGVAGLAGTIRSTRLKDQECQYCDAQGVLIDQRTPLEGEAHVLYECGLNEGLRQDHKRLFECNRARFPVQNLK